jgi:hypothetical protein
MKKVVKKLQCYYQIIPSQNLKPVQSTACKVRKWPATKAADDVPSRVLK